MDKGNRSMQVTKDQMLFAQSNKIIAGMLISLFLLGGCRTDKDAVPSFYQKTAAKIAPDLTQEDIHTKDGHVIKFEGTYVRSYKDGKKDGITALYQHGVLYAEKSYKSGVLHGLSSNYSFPFTVSEIYYVDGKKHGTEKVWCDSDRKKLKSRTQYSHGILEGRSEEWRCDKSHKPLFSREYKNGKKYGLETMYTMRSRHEIPYKNDKKDGVEKYYFDDILSWSVTYKDGIRDGISKDWYAGTRKLKKQTMFKKGREFDMNGNFIPQVAPKEQE